jgi:hypothetical protein
MPYLESRFAIVKNDKGISTYVKATNPIGPVVENLTGIERKRPSRTKGFPFLRP